MPGPTDAGLNMPPGETPGPLNTPVPGTPPISLACVIWNGTASRQTSGILLNCTSGVAFTVIGTILSVKQIIPEYAIIRIV